MSRSLLIAGNEHWSDLLDDTLSIELGLTYDSDACSFEVGIEPNIGDSVLISDSNIGNIYGGVIVKTKANYHGKPVQSVSWAIECDDYSAILDRKLVAETYESKTAEYIVNDILAKYADDSFSLDSSTESPTIEKMVFDYVSVSECIRQISDYIGWSWTISPDKVISFFNPQIILQPAPIEIIPGAYFDNFSFEIDSTQLRNYIYVIGGKMLNDTQVYEFKADGISTAWPLPFDPVEISAFSVAGISKTIAEEKTVSESEAAYFFNRKDKRLRTTKSATAPESGVTIHIEYKDYIDVIDIAEDPVSIAAIAARQEGTNGICEHTIRDEKLITLEAVWAAGDADLRENANPKVTGSFTTESGPESYVAAWKPGQIVRIALPDRRIDNHYMVQSVSIEPFDTQTWQYTVKYGGRLIGIDDFLKALLNNQRTETAKVDTLHKFVKQSESVKVTDEIYTVSRSTPYLIEASQYGLLQTAGRR